MKYRYIHYMIVLLLIVSVASAGRNIIVSDNFDRTTLNSAGYNWTGSTISNGHLAAGNNFIVNYNVPSTATDYVASVFVGDMIQYNTHYGLMWRYQDSSNYYYLDIHSFGRQAYSIGVYKKVGGVSTRIGAFAVPDQPRNHTMSVMTRGNTFYIFLNGQMMTYVVDSTFSSGRVGMYSGAGWNIYYDDFIVYTTTPQYGLSGRVYESSKPLKGVIVWDSELTDADVTDSAGAYALSGLSGASTVTYTDLFRLQPITEQITFSSSLTRDKYMVQYPLIPTTYVAYNTTWEGLNLRFGGNINIIGAMLAVNRTNITMDCTQDAVDTSCFGIGIYGTELTTQGGFKMYNSLYQSANPRSACDSGGCYNNTFIFTDCWAGQSHPILLAENTVFRGIGYGSLTTTSPTFGINAGCSRGWIDNCTCNSSWSCFIVSGNNNYLMASKNVSNHSFSFIRHTTFDNVSVYPYLISGTSNDGSRIDLAYNTYLGTEGHRLGGFFNGGANGDVHDNKVLGGTPNYGFSNSGAPKNVHYYNQTINGSGTCIELNGGSYNFVVENVTCINGGFGNNYGNINTTYWNIHMEGKRGIVGSSVLHVGGCGSYNVGIRMENITSRSYGNDFNWGMSWAGYNGSFKNMKLTGRYCVYDCSCAIYSMASAYSACWMTDGNIYENIEIFNVTTGIALENYSNCVFKNIYIESFFKDIAFIRKNKDNKFINVTHDVVVFDANNTYNVLDYYNWLLVNIPNWAGSVNVYNNTNNLIASGVSRLPVNEFKQNLITKTVQYPHKIQVSGLVPNQAYSIQFNGISKAPQTADTAGQMFITQDIIGNMWMSLVPSGTPTTTTTTFATTLGTTTIPTTTTTTTLPSCQAACSSHMYPTSYCYSSCPNGDLTLVGTSCSNPLVCCCHTTTTTLSPTTSSSTTTTLPPQTTTTTLATTPSQMPPIVPIIAVVSLVAIAYALSTPTVSAQASGLIVPIVSRKHPWIAVAGILLILSSVYFFNVGDMFGAPAEVINTPCNTPGQEVYGGQCKTIDGDAGITKAVCNPMLLKWESICANTAE